MRMNPYNLDISSITTGQLPVVDDVPSKRPIDHGHFHAMLDAQRVCPTESHLFDGKALAALDNQLLLSLGKTVKLCYPVVKGEIKGAG